MHDFFSMSSSMSIWLMYSRTESENLWSSGKSPSDLKLKEEAELLKSGTSEARKGSMKSRFGAASLSFNSYGTTRDRPENHKRKKQQNHENSHKLEMHQKFSGAQQVTALNQFIINCKYRTASNISKFMFSLILACRRSLEALKSIFHCSETKGGERERMCVTEKRDGDRERPSNTP